MGQQQLLLLVLGIVIVGLAVVVGIQAFSENQKRANLDAMVNDAIRIASDVQAWKLKPAAFGGGSDAEGFTGVTLQQLGYEVDDGVYQNLNGEFTLTGGTTATIDAESCANGNGVEVVISGTRPEDLATTISTDVDCSES